MLLRVVGFAFFAVSSQFLVGSRAAPSNGGGGAGPGAEARRGGGRRAHGAVGEAEEVPARRVPHRRRPEADVGGSEVWSPAPRALSNPLSSRDCLRAMTASAQWDIDKKKMA